MSEHKSPEQVSDEDYKVEPTNADKNVMSKLANKNRNEEATGENYQLPPEDKVRE